MASLSSALTLTVHFTPVTLWLFVAVPGLIVLGIVLMAITGELGWELGALAPMVICFVLACVALLLAIGSML